LWGRAGGGVKYNLKIVLAFFFFLTSLEGLEKKPLKRFSRVIAQKTWFCDTKCLLGVAFLPPNFFTLFCPKNPFFGVSAAKKAEKSTSSYVRE
jgi:hypothetical protein